MIDRTLSPVPGPLPAVHFPEIRVAGLDNGIELYAVRHGSEPVTEIQVIIPAGKAIEPLTGLADMTAGLLSEGTGRRTGESFARELDSLGASFGAEVTQEVTVIHMSALTRNLRSSLGLLFEGILMPAFEDAEVQLYRERLAQGMEVEQMKTGYQARKHFNGALFGSHPYGRVAGLDDIPKLNRNAVMDFHAAYYSIPGMKVVVCGDFDQDLLGKWIMEALTAVPATGSPVTPAQVPVVVSNSPGMLEIPVREAVQCTVRVGHTAFHRLNPDFDAMQLVTMLYGGFFGSRLMKNIREEKGYTYGIYASWACMKEGGMFVIQADVAPRYVADTIAQVTLEMRRMQDDIPDADEVEVVRNYMMGRMLGSRETPGQLAEIVRNAIVFGIPFSHIDARFEIIRNIGGEHIRNLARKWFDPDRLLTVVAGKIS